MAGSCATISVPVPLEPISKAPPSCLILSLIPLIPTPGVPVDTARFYDVLLADYGTYVGAGHWFEVDDRQFRLGFGWPTEGELRAGLTALSTAAADAANGSST